MSGPFQRIITGIVFFLIVCAVSVVGYALAGWSLMDALYMTIITIFGVGYGEVQPVQSPGLRALTITTIVAGYAAVIYTVGGFVQMLIDGELNKALGARRMMKEIERLEGHTIICGMGRMGTILVRELTAAGKQFVVIDSDPRHLTVGETRSHLLINGDATEEHVLEQAGIHRAAALATVLSDDATNVFITITARGMNSQLLIFARGENPRTEKKLLGCGANKVVLPTAIGATKVAQLIIRPTAEDVLAQITHDGLVFEELSHIGLHFDELEVAFHSTLVGKTLNDIEVRSNHGFLIVAIRHTNGAVIINPDSSTVLESGDVVIVLGHDDDIPQLAARFASGDTAVTYRGTTF